MISVYQKPVIGNINNGFSKSEIANCSGKKRIKYQCQICFSFIGINERKYKCVKCYCSIHYNCLLRIQNIKNAILGIGKNPNFICELCFYRSEYLISTKAKCYFCNCSNFYLFLYPQSIFDCSSFDLKWIHLHCYFTYTKYKNKMLSLFIYKEKCLLCNKNTKERMVNCNYISCNSKIHYCCFVQYSIDKFNSYPTGLRFNCEKYGIQSHFK